MVMTMIDNKRIKQLSSPHGSSRLYVTKVIPPTEGIISCIMMGNIIEDSRKAGLSFREYLWKIICEWDSPSDDQIAHWQLILCDLQPSYYKHCFIVDYPQFEGAAQTLLRCLQYMEHQDFLLGYGKEKFGIKVEVYALH
jgi:hypothetical protein